MRRDAHLTDGTDELGLGLGHCRPQLIYTVFSSALDICLCRNSSCSCCPDGAQCSGKWPSWAMSEAVGEIHGVQENSGSNCPIFRIASCLPVG